jgi:ribosomal protein S18 acetylase RimI-like enzyme
MGFEYIEGGKELLDPVEPLWKKLNELHKEVSPHFTEKYRHRTFAERKIKLLKKAKKSILRIDLARDLNSNHFVGYCISTVNQEKIGEIESIYIEPKYQKQGIGDNLMRKANLDG